jgi:ribose-phosphate pyrophosphokinase
MIKVSVGNGVFMQNLPVEVSTFKGGEVNVRLPEAVVKNLFSLTFRGERVEITGHLTNSDLVMAFFLTIDALRRIAPVAKIHVFIPYLPYARQDRVCNVGEALSLSMFAQMLNAMQLESVSLFDPHSDVSAAVIDRSFVTTQKQMLGQVVEHQILSLDTRDLMLVAPDAGAVKKIKALSEALDIPYVTATKTRDPKTMEVSAARLDGDVAGKNLIVVDDICDGGRTFIQLGKILRDEGCKELSLFVSHGIFSYGLEPVLDVFDRIYTTDSFHPDCTSELRLHSEKFRNHEQLRRVHWFPL